MPVPEVCVDTVYRRISLEMTLAWEAFRHDAAYSPSRQDGKQLDSTLEACIVAFAQHFRSLRASDPHHARVRLRLYCLGYLRTTLRAWSEDDR